MTTAPAAFARVERGVERAAAILALVGAVGLGVATLVTCVSVALRLVRRTLDAGLGWAVDPALWSGVRPIFGEEEIVTYAVALALFCALPWATLTRGHVRVDLISSAIGARFDRLLDLIGDLAIAALAYLIASRQWYLIFAPARRAQEPMGSALLQGDFSVIAERLRDRDETQILGLPLWPTYVVAELCMLAFLLAAAFCVLRSARALVLGARR